MDSTFVVMTDTHFVAPGNAVDECYWNRMFPSKSTAIGESLVSTVTALAPDFVIHCGDLTNSSDLESFHFAKTIMDRLPCPYYWVPGNHDTWSSGVREAMAPLFEFSAGGKFYYTRELAGIRFIFLDCAYWIKRDGTECEDLDFELHKQKVYAGIGPTQAELHWLERELAADRETPTIIVNHTPLHAKPTYAIGTLPGAHAPEVDLANWDPAPEKQFGDGDTTITKKYCVHGPTIRQMLADAPNIVATFAGHWHFNDITCDDNGVVHCQGASLIEYPFEFRLVKIRGDQMSISTVGLDNSQFEQESLVPEWRNDWVAGKDGDRSWTGRIDQLTG